MSDVQLISPRFVISGNRMKAVITLKASSVINEQRRKATLYTMINTVTNALADAERMSDAEVAATAKYVEELSKEHQSSET